MTRRQAGFTLLEILIAVAVLGMLLVLLNQGVAFGLRAAAMQRRADAGAAADMPAVDAALRRMIAAADPGIFPEPASLKGTARSLSLITEMPGPDGMRQRVDATVFASGGQLRLRWRPHRHVTWFANQPAAQEMTLLDGVSGLQFAFAAPGNAEWRASWTADTLPALVRVQITFERPKQHWPPILAAPLLEPLGQ